MILAPMISYNSQCKRRYNAVPTMYAAPLFREKQNIIKTAIINILGISIIALFR